MARNDPYRWPPEKRAETEEALRSSRTRAEAARKLGVGLGALDHACHTYGLEPRALLARRPAPSLGGAAAYTDPAPEPLIVDPSAPAWQGYRPRAGWSKPEPVAAVKPRKVETETRVWLGDVHCPYHLRSAWSVVLGVLREVKPKVAGFIGDVMDMESLSRHPKSKPDLVRLSEEYYATNLLLDEAQNASPSSDWYFLEGNHEGRAPRYCAEFGTLDGMLSVPQSLYIEPRSDYHRAQAENLRGMRWIPLRMQPFAIGPVGYLHGVFEAKHHAAAHAENLGPSKGMRHLVYGHMHGFQQFTSAAGYDAHCIGWLGDETRHVFQSYVKGKPRPWGVGLLIQEVSGDHVTNTEVRIVNGRALFGGRIVEARAA